MKKLIFASVFALALSSCGREDSLISENPSINSVNFKMIQRDARPSDDPLAKDGYVHVYGDELFYMGEKLEPSKSEEAQYAIKVAETSNSDTGRPASVFCQATNGAGTRVSLVVVYGEGRPETYWIVYTYSNGSSYATQWENPAYGDCFWLHFNASFGKNTK